MISRLVSDDRGVRVYSFSLGAYSDMFSRSRRCVIFLAQRHGRGIPVFTKRVTLGRRGFSSEPPPRCILTIVNLLGLLLSVSPVRRYIHLTNTLKRTSYGLHFTPQVPRS